MDKESVLLDSEDRMDKALGALDRDFSRLRTGRASTGLVDNIKVDYYGTPTPISQLASVAIPDSRTITIQPWDRGAFASVEKAILKSDLGLTPVNDGKIIRISIPPLTEDRRKELGKLARKSGEEAKVAVRNVRRDANDQLKKLEKDKAISEDELKKATDDVQKLTDKYVAKVDEKCAAKEKEIMDLSEVRAGRGGDHMKKVPFSPSRPLPPILLGFSADGERRIGSPRKAGKTLFRQISFERVSVSKVHPAGTCRFRWNSHRAACRDIRP